MIVFSWVRCLSQKQVKTSVAAAESCDPEMPIVHIVIKVKLQILVVVSGFCLE